MNDKIEFVAQQIAELANIRAKYLDLDLGHAGVRGYENLGDAYVAYKKSLIDLINVVAERSCLPRTLVDLTIKNVQDSEINNVFINNLNLNSKLPFLKNVRTEDNHNGVVLFNVDSNLYNLGCRIMLTGGNVVFPNISFMVDDTHEYFVNGVKTRQGRFVVPHKNFLNEVADFCQVPDTSDLRELLDQYCKHLDPCCSLYGALKQDEFKERIGLSQQDHGKTLLLELNCYVALNCYIEEKAKYETLHHIDYPCSMNIENALNEIYQTRKSNIHLAELCLMFSNKALMLKEKNDGAALCFKENFLAATENMKRLC